MAKTTTKKYSFDDHPEYRDQLKPWAEKWIANALNTTPMDDTDRAAMVAAMDGMYRAAKLDPPRHVVFVASPIAGAIVAGVAAGVWHLIEHLEAHAAMFGRVLTPTEIRVAQTMAVHHCVDAAFATQRGEDVPRLGAALPTDAATDAATRAATGAATYAATGAATYAATRAATRAATDAATYAATRAATDAATEIARCARFLIGCVARWYGMYSGGSSWSGWTAYLSFFRHVAKLELDYSAWDHFEKATIHASWRFTHARFAVVCDRPTTIGRDDQNRAHALDGPQIAWRDGFASYSIHGVRVNAKIIERRFTVADIDAQDNAEVRRVMIDLYGRDRFMLDGGAKVLDEDIDELGNRRQLLRREVDDDEPIVAIRVINSTPEPDGTSKEYQMRVHPELRPIVRREPAEYGRPQAMTCANAAAWLAQVAASKFELEFQT